MVLPSPLQLANFQPYREASLKLKRLHACTDIKMIKTINFRKITCSYIAKACMRPVELHAPHSPLLIS